MIILVKVWFSVFGFVTLELFCYFRRDSTNEAGSFWSVCDFDHLLF